MVVYISIVFHSLWPWYLHSRYAKRVRGEVCLIVMLSRFEELDIIQQLEREVKDSAGVQRGRKILFLGMAKYRKWP